MARSDSDWVKESIIASSLNMSPTTLTKALKKLRERKIIKRYKSGSGLYKLRTKSFAIWIRNIEK